MGTQPPHHKGGGAPSPIFGPFLLWPNGWMHQDATWYGGRPWPMRHCVRWAPSSPFPKGAQPPKFSANVRCHQAAGWTKIPVGMEVGLGPGDCVRWVPSSPREKGTAPTQFLAHVYCGQMSGWIKTPLGTEVHLGPGHIVLDEVRATAKGAQQPPSFRPMSIVATVVHLSYC